MAILGGGNDRAWLEPLDQEGNRPVDSDEEFDRMVGCHTGNYFGLNVFNPQPGNEYVWERNTDRDKLRCRREGGQIVDGNDPEFAALRTAMGANEAAPIDSLNVYNDVILFRYPESAIRRKREQEQAKAQRMMRSGAEAFINRATDAEREIAQGRPTRFAGKAHRTDFGDPAGNIVDQWVPDDGIIEK